MDRMPASKTSPRTLFRTGAVLAVGGTPAALDLGAGRGARPERQERTCYCEPFAAATRGASCRTGR